MRVISGKFKGKKLLSLEGKNTRPTTSRVKEDMFNILNNYFIFEEKVSLDLFGGSGALSIEGLSRGIKKAYINDLYKPAFDVIKENLKSIDNSLYVLFNLDWKQVFSRLQEKVDIIYLDPPFKEKSYYYDFFDILKNNDYLNLYGVVSVQSEFELEIEKISYLNLLKLKKYKNKFYYLLRKEEENEKR